MTINSSFKPVAAFALACLITFPNVCDARRFGGAGSRSSFGSSSRRSDSSYDRSQSNSSYNQPSSYSGKPSPPKTPTTNMNYLLWEKGYDYHGKPNWSPPAHVRAKRAGTYVPHYSRGRGGLGIAFFVGLVVIVFFIGGAAVIAGIAILASKSRTK